MTLVTNLTIIAGHRMAPISIMHGMIGADVLQGTQHSVKEAQHYIV